MGGFVDEKQHMSILSLSVSVARSDSGGAREEERKDSPVSLSLLCSLPVSLLEG